MSSVLTMEEGGVYHITLNRPQRHNAFDPQMVEELTKAFEDVVDIPNVRAVFLSGEGPSFCSGADLDWMKSMVEYNLKKNTADSTALFEMFEAGYNCSLPIVGRFHGNVMGGGLGLASLCDISAATEDTQFCFSEVRLGLVPAVISPFVLKRMNATPASEYMLTGRRFTAHEAKQSGLVNFVGTTEQVDDYCHRVLNRLFVSGPEAVSETKKLLHYVRENEWSQVKKETARVIAERRVSEEGQAGLKSFFERSEPDWKINR